ncbi:hypothetical protein VMCG_10120 [Cytospora schulzeri]|uniref:Uncharacterized protein n=1 Tax=Cytospora schulzeri TaxID=448051 RepID=A0A423VGA2_9PEZI|nr:hypothetical protein VMCG_10120 [Valsa malicola]
MSELYVPVDGVGDSDLLSSTTYPSFEKGNAGRQNMQWRPRSAPKNMSRTPSPFLGFLNRKGNHQQDDAGLRRTKDVDTESTEKMYSVEGTAVGIHTSHHDIALPSRSALGTPNSSKESTNGSENGGPPPLTREEFEALPLAIQRKYFSTLERLRFAQESTDVDGIYNHYDDITSHKSKRRKHGQKRSAPDPRPFRDSHATTGTDGSWFLNVPERPKNGRLTREEQCELVKHMRASVILDAADEAIYNLRHKNSNRALTPSSSDIDWSTPTLLTRRGSLDSMASNMMRTKAIGQGDPARESLYESFRWLDEEDDLDLRLFLDDYHANLREELPLTSKNRQPSFRRHLSISKLPFGRPSFSSTRTDAKDATGRESPVPSLATTQHQTSPFEHARRRSHTMSLRRHGYSESLPAIDPGAAHYQDPEARLKLRVYLASPQKFDEAIEFGFPATDAVETPPTVQHRRSVLKKRQSRQNLNDDTDNMHTFLDDGDDDDDLSDEDADADADGAGVDFNDDASSISELDSPKTPQLGGLTPPPGHHRPTRVSTEPLHQAAVRGMRPQMPVNDSLYAAIPASSREMTLRMTLTRPDLRADDDLIYGWQAQQQQQQHHHQASGNGRKSPSNALRDEASFGAAGVGGATTTTTCTGQPPVSYLGQGRPPKDTIEAILTGNDHHYGPEAAGGDKNFMKRIFNRVRRS